MLLAAAVVPFSGRLLNNGKRKMENGTIVTVRDDRGFGFISAAGVDYFFHASDLSDELEFSRQLQERRVTFNIVESGKGLRAANVRPAE
jgi:cold shock CspA family protein